LWDEALGGHVCVVLGGKVDWAAKMPEGQKCIVSGECGSQLREGNWRKLLRIV